MEEWQRKHIQKNLVELVKVTLCNPHLIARFAATKVLCSADVESLQLPHLTPFEKSMKLYEILKTRVGAYEILLNALEETGQTGAVKILKNHNPVFKKFGSISYDRNHILGTGCLGTKVYQGTCGDRVVAIKVINAEFVDPKVAQREVEVLKKVDYHENIIRYFIAECDDNLICIALELCVVSLQDEVKLNLIKMNPVDILEKCTKGLAHLHKNKIIHRDMKPANILFTANKQVKISDFGVSKQIPAGRTSVSLHSGVVGTADWMAPEVMQLLIEGRGAGQRIRMSTSADIFSLGCIFVFTLTNGSHPFGETISRQHHILNNTPQMETLKIEIDWQQLAKKMISPLSSNRPSAEEVLASNCFRLNGARAIKDQESSTTSGEESVDQCLTSNQSSSISHLNLKFSQLPVGSNVTENKMSGCGLEEPESKKPGTAMETSGSSECRGKKDVQISRKEVKPSTSKSKSLSPTTPENIHTWNEGLNKKLETGPENHFETSGEDKLSSLTNCRHKTYNEKIQELLMKYIGRYNKNDNDNDLFTLVELGVQQSELEEIVKLGCDWQTKDNNGKSVLHIAAKCGNLDALKYFISLGADVNSTSNIHRTLIHQVCAAKQNFQETLKYLLENNLEINTVDSYGDNAVLLAATWGRSMKELEEIVRLGGDWKKRNKQGHSVLHRAAQGGNVEALKYFISLGADVNCRDNDQFTVLHSSCIATQNFKESLKYLLQNNLEINAINSNGENLVLLAAKLGRRKDDLEEIVRLGGDWKKKTTFGDSVLHFVAANGNLETLKYFISLGADVNCRDHDQLTVLHTACQSKQHFKEMLIFLMENDLDINAVDSEGNNAVVRAAGCGRTKEELEEIVKFGGDWRIKNKNGHTVLHAVAECGNEGALKYFISLGADVNVKANNGVTPVHQLLSTTHNFKMCLHILCVNGASLNAQAANGETLEIMLQKAGKTDELNILKKYL